MKTVYTAAPLQRKLALIPSFPLSILIAPLGFGKSTTLVHYLQQTRRQFLLVRCTAENLPDMCLLRTAQHHGYDCQDLSSLMQQLPKDCVLIFEDYHHCADSSDANQALLHLLHSLRGRASIVLLTRHDTGLATNSPLLLHGELYRLETEDFCVDTQDLQQWCQGCGMSLTPYELQHMMEWTEGWPVLCYLSMMEYQRIGSPQYNNPYPLMKEIYTSLSESCRKLLWYLSAVIDFTDEDAAILWGSKDGVALVQQLRAEGAPVLKKNGTWHLHHVFASYVQQQAETLNDVSRSSINRRLGKWYQSRGDMLNALPYFEQISDWDQILTLIEEDAGRSLCFSFTERVTRLLLTCPREILTRHPLAQFHVCRMIAAFGSSELLQRWTFADTCDADMVSVLASFPDLEQMTRYCRSLRESSRKPPTTRHEPFTLGRLSLLSSYWHIAGQAEGSLRYLEEFLNLYIPLSDQHGAGSIECAKAELLLLRGNFADAQIQAHSAFLIAKEQQQFSVQLCALFLLARCSFALGEADETARYLTRLHQKAGQNHMLQQCADLAVGWFLSLLGKTEQCAFWLREGELSQTEFLPSARADSYVVTGAVLLAQKEWPRLIAFCQRWLEQLPPYGSDLVNIYLYIYLSIAYDRLVKPNDGLRALQEALRLARQDHICLPFAEFHVDLLPRLRTFAGDPFVDDCISSCSAYQRRTKKLRTNQKTQIDGLTERESQIAYMMCDGLRNTDIAAQLQISVNTVKTTIRHINAKLKVGNRHELAEKLKN